MVGPAANAKHEPYNTVSYNTKKAVHKYKSPFTLIFTLNARAESGRHYNIYFPEAILSRRL